MNGQTCCNQLNKTSIEFDSIEHNEKRTLWVVLLTLVMMVFEIIAGHITGSMALLADGYHMASHAGALGIAYLVYRLAKSQRLKNKLSFGTGKLLPLGGYTSAVGLGMIALWMVVESITRFLSPTEIYFTEAIIISVIGLVVNLLSAFILGSGHHHHDHDHGHDHDHDHEHHHHHVEDHNHKSALVHVIADAMTSVLAIIALCAGKYFNLNWLDPLMGIVGALVILRWAYGLCKETAWELLDAQPKNDSIQKIKETIEQSNAKVIDLHLWKIGPANHVCQMIVESSQKRGQDYYRKFLPAEFGAVHLVIEER